MFSCIVIDDERLARERIADFVEQQADWQVVAQTGEYHQAYQMIIYHQPDICFMDINIIGGNGVELVEELSNKVSCQWVFTTAYSQSAATAFELNAIDYILKPFENSRLAGVLHKVERLRPNQVKMTKNILAVKSVGAVEFVNVEDILWIKGSANYVELHCVDRMLLHRETLAKLESQLDPEKFVRVHRSAMVNIEKVSSLSSELGRFSLLYLNNGDEVKIGQGHKANLFTCLGLEHQY